MKYLKASICGIIVSTAVASAIAQSQSVTARVASGTLGRAEFMIERCGGSPELLRKVDAWASNHGAQILPTLAAASKASENRLWNEAENKTARCGNTATLLNDALAN